MKILILFLMIFSFSTQASIASDYDKGLEAAISGDFETAFKIWMPLAKEGDPYAQNGLGMLYRRGDGVKKDPKKAAKWFQLSADQGFLMPMYSLAEMYEIGEGIPLDYKKSFELYSVAAENGLVDAQTTLGTWYEAGHGGLEQDYKKSFEWYLLAAQQKDVFAMCRIAYRYEDGLGTQKDTAKAKEYYDAVIALGQVCGE